MPELLENMITATPHLYRGISAVGSPIKVLPTGFLALDRALPSNGWPRGMLTEILTPTTGIGELRLLAPALRGVTGANEHAVLIAPPHLPFAPALEYAQINLQYLLLIKTNHNKHALWAADKALRNPACSLVLLWMDKQLSIPHMRRLQLAAAEGNAALIIYRSTADSTHNQWANLRLRIQPQLGGLYMELLKAPGLAQTRQCTVYFEDE